MDRKLRFLVVDDHVDTANVIALLLDKEGHKATAVNSYREALDAATRERFDVAICDVALPDGSGNNLMHELTAKYGMSGIALTGMSRAGVIQADEAAFRAVLLKPVEFSELRGAIEKAAGPN
jgi:two-component system CheB/CheR fusion protein